MIKNYISIFVLFMLTLSCEKELDVDIVNETPKLVVNALFNPDSTWSVDITRNGNILDINPYYSPVKDALVTIFDQNDQPVETLSYAAIKNPQQQFPPVERGVYKGKTKPSSNKNYTVRVDVSNEISAQAVGHTPNQVQLTVIEIDSSYLQSDRRVEMKIALSDPVDKKNYYQIKILGKMKTIQTFPPSTGRKDSIINVSDVETQFESVNETPIVTARDLLLDTYFNGKMKTMKLHVYPPNNTFPNPYYHREFYDYRIVLMNISEEYYKYYSTITLYNDTHGNPLAQPVQIFSNIENGFGIFAGYGASMVKIK